MMSKEGSLAYLEGLFATRPALKNTFRLHFLENHEDFLGCLHNDLEQIITDMQERKQFYFDKSEDELSNHILFGLRQKQYDAEHEPSIGGHCDLVVRSPCRQYLWLGEAKLDRGPEWINQGFEQLCNRYSTGEPSQDVGGLLIYCRGMKSTKILQNWRAKLRSRSLEDFKDWDCPLKKHLSFYSSHTLPSTGLPYTIRHRVVTLHFNPTV
ncbi:hypothetical protein [Chitinimonas lacunae]|uniref:PD-(D/E)XK nuclease superfamily protein n=1 Tax=Chitinimonas lacunae TaxID=1963018 RepID=A0ABV8MJG1_9NEIS